MVSWPMTLKVKFRQFDGHINNCPLLRLKHKMRTGIIHTNIILINRTVLTKLHEIIAF